MRTKNKKNVPVKDFIRIWQMAENKDEVREKTGLTAGAIRTRLLFLRKNGVPLKDMRGLRRYDFAALREYAKAVLTPKSHINERMKAGRK